MSDILQVITDTDRRGAQIFACNLGEQLASTGHEVHTVALAPGRDGGLDIPTLGPRRRSLATLQALRRAGSSAGIVIAHGSTTLPACAIALAGTGTPFVYRQISDVVFWTASWARRQRARAALSRSARVVALWDGAANTMSTRFGYDLDRIDVVPNGVPTVRFRPATSDEAGIARAEMGVGDATVVAVHMGALVLEKGVDRAIDAVSRVPGLTLLVVGDGPQRIELQERAQRVAPGRVVFHGPVDDARRAYAAADIVVLASRGGECMPAVLIEAGLMGIPAVTTAIEATHEIVLDTESGFVVPTDGSGVERALGRLAGDLELRRAMGRTAVEHCRKNFGIDVVAEKWAAVLARAGR